MLFVTLVTLIIHALACTQDLEPTSGSCDPLCSLDETSSLDFEATYQSRADLVKALAISAAAAISLSWVAANQVYLNLM